MAVKKYDLKVYWNVIWLLTLKPNNRIRRLILEANFNNFSNESAFLRHPSVSCVIDNRIFFCSDREIQFYELSTFEAYCQISSLETVPLRLDYKYVYMYVCMHACIYRCMYHLCCPFLCIFSSNSLPAHLWISAKPPHDLALSLKIPEFLA